MLDRIGSHYLVPREEVVLGLLDDRADEVEAGGDGTGLSDLLGGPLGSAPVECPALVDDMVHGADGLLDGGGGVRAVAQDDVDVVHVEAAEGGAGALDEVLPGEALVVGAGAAPEDLGGHDDVGPAPTELADGLAHDLLRSAVGVDLGVVEEVHAVIAAALQQDLRLLDIDLVPERDPRPVRELAHLQPRSPQVLVLHLGFLPLLRLSPPLFEIDLIFSSSSLLFFFV